MKPLAWNCRGLASARAVHALLEVQRQINPDMFFLSETHLDNAKADNVRRRASYERMIVHESDGRTGGCCCGEMTSMFTYKASQRIISTF
jgi:hypothetical protein